MSNLKTKLKVMPVHAIIMCISALISLIGIFIPVFELFVQYNKTRVYSLLTLLTNPRVFVQLRNGSVDLNFQMFGIGVFIVTMIVSVAALTLALGFQLYSDNPKTKRWGCFSVAILLILRIAVHVYTLGNFITEKMMNDNKLNAQRLYVVQNIWGNIMVVVFALGIVAAIYGALGLQMHMKLMSYPYMAWVVIFTILPLFLILFRAFFASTGSGYQFTLDGFKTLFDPAKKVNATFYGQTLTLQENFSVFIRSLDYAAWTTIGCLILGYPLAYILADRTKKMHKTSSKFLLLFVLPMWMNTMLRTYAWRAFFGKMGVLNTFLASVGLISNPIDFLGNPVTADIITKVVMVNDFLPFMILPIYSVLVKIDSSLSQAAADLGATRTQCFTKVIFPLSLPGVISGIQMVFMPSMTFYMIPDIISEGSRTTIGNTVQSFILNESKAAQQAGNALSLLLLIFVLITMGILRNQDKEASGNGGMVL